MTSRNNPVRRITIHANGKSNQVLGSETMDLAPFPSQSDRVYGNNIIGLAIGSPLQLIMHSYKAKEENCIETGGPDVLGGASSTLADLDPLIRLSELHPNTIRTTKGLLPRNESYRLHRPAILFQHLGGGSIGGFASNPELTIDMLESNPNLLIQVLKFVDRIAQACLRFGMIGATTVTWSGFGGTMPVKPLVVGSLKKRVTVNWHLDVLLLPSSEEPLAQANATGECYRLILEGVQPNQILIFKRNDRRGKQHDDDALVNGVEAITGTVAGARELDGSTLARLLRNNGCGIVEARTGVVNVPLIMAGRRWPFRRERYLMDLPDYARDRMMEQILRKARAILELDPHAFHLLTLAGDLNDDEIAAFKKAAMRFLHHGRVVPVVVRMFPSIEAGTKRLTLCDFSTKHELPQVILDVVEGKSESIEKDMGMSPAQVAANIVRPKEADNAFKVHEALTRILQTL